MCNFSEILGPGCIRENDLSVRFSAVRESCHRRTLISSFLLIQWIKSTDLILLLCEE